MIPDNVVSLQSSRGFTRMDNRLMEALATVDLSARDLRVLMAIARKTIGYQLETKRLTADEIGKLTNMRRDVTSKSISHLLERRIIFRVGGSRGDIGISPISEWAFYPAKPESLTETKPSHSDNIVSLRSVASETKTATCLLYTKKKPLTTLSTKEVVTPQVVEAVPEAKSKPERKAPFGMIQMQATNPHQIPDQLLVDWLALRKTKRAAVSVTVWDALNTELGKCADLGISAADAMTEALSAGWQGFKADWIANRLAQAGRAQSSTAAGPDFYSTAWRTDLSDEL